MQAVGKKNRTSLHSLYDFVLMTRGILCIGTRGPTYKRTRGLLCVGISTYNKKKVEDFKVQLDRIKEESSGHPFEAQPAYPMYKTFFHYYNKGFEGLKMSPEEFVDQLSAGFFLKNKTADIPTYESYSLVSTKNMAGIVVI